jgi:hypothetical protein
MRRIKARVYTDGKDYCAYTAGASTEEFNGKTSVDGYIEVPLKKATSRNKGNSLELEVAKAFDKWLYDGKGVLTRTPLSGGWNGSKLGDITADPSKLMDLKLQIPKLYVECKNREGLLSEEFFNWYATGSPKRMNDWISDTVKKAGDQPWFIVLKGRGTEPWVFTPYSSPAAHLIKLNAYCMFPLKQLGATYTYSDLKSRILGG